MKSKTHAKSGPNLIDSPSLDMPLTEAEEARIAESEQLCAEFKRLGIKAIGRADITSRKTPPRALGFFKPNWSDAEPENAASVAPVKPEAAPAPVTAQPSPVAAMSRHAFDALDNAAKQGFLRAGGRLVDLPKPAPAASYLPACDANFVPEDGAGKTMLRGPFFSLSPRDQAAWVRSGGRIVDVATATTVSPRSRTIDWAAFTNLTDHEKQCFFRNGGRLVD